MAVVRETVKCPYCFEPIMAKATRCRHCHADLVSTTRKRTFGKHNTFRTGFLAGVLFTIIMAVLIYLQFSS
ncbi:MAG TPA: hypothetical protein VMY05_07730 [Acidobacteriota bacterium]|nr:hypothetical protein [Acidobacteriota bacterium]